MTRDDLRRLAGEMEAQAETLGECAVEAVPDRPLTYLLLDLGRCYAALSKILGLALGLNSPRDLTAAALELEVVAGVVVFAPAPTRDLTPSAN
jgi:hypothetical protein